MADRFPRLLYAVDGRTKVVSEVEYADALAAGWLDDPPLAVWYPHAVPAPAADVPPLADAPPPTKPKTHKAKA